MKEFLILLLICCLGCQKSKPDVKCYVCEMTYSNGTSAAVQFPCVPDIEEWRSEQKDNNGNPLLSACKQQ